MTGPADETPTAATEQAAADIEPVTPVAGSTVDSPFGVEGRGMFGVSDSGDTTGFGGLVREPWSAPAATRPFGGYFDEVVDALAAAYPEFDAAVTKIVVDRDELTLYITKEHIRSLARTMRDDPALRALAEASSRRSPPHERHRTTSCSKGRSIVRQRWWRRGSPRSR